MSGEVFDWHEPDPADGFIDMGAAGWGSPFEVAVIVLFRAPAGVVFEHVVTAAQSGKVR